jgi:hypothetical protein
METDQTEKKFYSELDQDRHRKGGCLFLFGLTLLVVLLVAALVIGYLLL